jgi:glycosyltransferase involved in cell wall biosynthesis
MQDAILFDLAEFMEVPLRTGIQRVTFEVASRWPADALPLMPVISAPSGCVRGLPRETLDLMAVYFGRRPGDAAAARAALVAIGRAADLPPVDPADYRAFLNLELFYTDWRLATYHSLLERIRDRLFFFLHDFLPVLAPRWFPKGIMHRIPLMDFVRLVRDIRHVAFNSEATRQDYLTRIVRRPRPAGPALPLGGDGLGIAPPRFNPENRRFTFVGSLEPRKNVGPILEAFRSLWAEGAQVRLTIVGRMISLPDDDRRLLDTLRQTQPLFEWLQDLDDAQVRDVIRGSRATLFVSRAEGFGIPPLESLALGVPVIVYAGVPSLGAVEGHGQLRLANPDAAAVREAVRAFLDDGFARRKSEEILRLRLPTWDGMARDMAGWIEDTLAAADGQVRRAA